MESIANHHGSAFYRASDCVMEGILTEIMYDIPSDPTVTKVVITRACVEGTAEPELTRDPQRVTHPVKLNTGKGDKPASGSAPKSAS